MRSEHRGGVAAGGVVSACRAGPLGVPAAGSLNIARSELLDLAATLGCVPDHRVCSPHTQG